MSENLHLSEEEISGNYAQDTALQVQRSIDARNSVPLTESRLMLDTIGEAIVEYSGYLPQLGVGPKTQAEFQKIIEKLQSPGAIQIDTHDGAYYESPEMYDAPFYSMDRYDFTLSFGHNFVDDVGAAIGDILYKLDVENIPSIIELNKLAIKYVTWHELSHALQDAAAYASGTHNDLWLVSKNRDRSGHDALKFRGFPEYYIENYIENERLSEGVGVMLLVTEMIDRGILGTTQADAYCELYADVWRDRPTYNKAVKLKEEWNSTKSSTSDIGELEQEFSSMAEVKYGRSLWFIMILGYANFYDKERILKILGNTP